MKKEIRWLQPPEYTHLTVIEATLEITSPMSIGGDNDLGGDSPILRDIDDKPFIPGTTLAGVLRSEMEDVVSTHCAKPSEHGAALLRLFGSAFGGEEESLSSLTFDDAFMEAGQTVVTELRDHVRLEKKTGIAGSGTKFDREMVATGTQFLLRIEWRTPENPKLMPKFDRELVLLLLARLEQGIAVGARTRRGFGAIRVTSGEKRWAWKTFDLTLGTDLIAWSNPSTSLPRTVDSVNLLAARLGGAMPSLPSRYSLELDLTLAIEHSLLIRDAGRSPGKKNTQTQDKEANKQADASHLQRVRLGAEKPEAILSSTSLVGVLRHRATAIAHLMAIESERPVADELVQLLFGVEYPEKTVAIPAIHSSSQPDASNKQNTPQTLTPKVKPKAGQITVHDAVVEGAKELRHTRVVLDPWTAGALEGFLFSEDVLYGGQVEAKLALSSRLTQSKYKEAALGLLFLTLRDLWESDLPVGGEVGVGRGVLRGISGTLTQGSHTESLVFDPKGRLVSGGTEIGAWVNAMNRELRGQMEVLP